MPSKNPPSDSTAPTRVRGKSQPIPIQSLFANYHLDDKGGYITKEFQDFGYRLAVELEDMAHKSLYIKLAKTVQRSILEDALSFVSDSQARSKGKLFMWKVKELKKQVKSSPKGKPSAS